ncbi:hypothetical protein BSL78_23581 [Apostichopus japonicus]|uniref:Reverse transcriptase domain-containing protein n=1 Tax=Stichopus japonicus TaxID=307972 RepID=A0A2G8JUY9_STIJA|nr:hypothetical protein BSL78_23581 [Apostichopus japonicus]
MDRILRPERFDADSNSENAAKAWKHWFKTFENFISVLTGEPNKLCILTNFVSPKVYESIADCTTYETAIKILGDLYVKPKNEIFARHLLATRRQEPGESLDTYLQALKTLANDCNFKSVTAEAYRDEYIRDSFISGLLSPSIRQRLLENKTLDLQTMHDQARALESAQKNSESYTLHGPPTLTPQSAAVKSDIRPEPLMETIDSASTTTAKCFFCGYAKHPRSRCPARDETCNKCDKRGHFAKDFQQKHSSVILKYGGDLPPLVLCGLTTLRTEPPQLFANLSPDIHPVAAKSRRYSSDDKKFIAAETQRLLREGIIEKSNSPWRAQVVVTKDENHKKRLAIDYSETINRFTLQDSYPLPRIDETVDKIAQYQVFSTIDLRSAYHQVPLKEDDKSYTAFESDGSLYQFTRVPFGVTNGVPCFQRIMDSFIEEEKLTDTFAYLDDITICGRDQKEHDHNLQRFLEAAKRKNIVYNENKCTFSPPK